MSRFFQVALALCALSAGPASAQSWGLPQLMHGLSEVRSASASFTEQKTMRMLSVPLIATGMLSYVAPDYVRKTTLTPVREDFVLDHGKVTLTGGPQNQTHVFSLAQAPQLSGLVEAIRATLAGDLPTLQRYYTLRLSGTVAHWQLLLTPKDASLTRFIAWMAISGSQNRIAEIDTASSNGDTSEMHVTETIGDAR